MGPGWPHNRPIGRMEITAYPYITFTLTIKSVRQKLDKKSKNPTPPPRNVAFFFSGGGLGGRQKLGAIRFSVFSNIPKKFSPAAGQKSIKMFGGAWEGATEMGPFRGGGGKILNLS